MSVQGVPGPPKSLRGLESCSQCGGATTIEPMCGMCSAQWLSLHISCYLEKTMTVENCKRCKKVLPIIRDGLCRDCFILHKFRPLMLRRDEAIRTLGEIERELIGAVEAIQNDAEVLKYIRPSWVCMCGELKTDSYVEAVIHYRDTTGYKHHISRDYSEFHTPRNMDSPQREPSTKSSKKSVAIDEEII